MELVNQTRSELIEYIYSQLNYIIPDKNKRNHKITIDRNIDQALSRIQICINAVRMWPKDKFNYMHSSQYCQFLYYLSNSAWHNEQNEKLCTELFILNKTLNGIDLFYEVEMPDIFFIGHSAGIVLAKASYSNYFAIYQNSTVGKNHGIAPVIESHVIMYPNSAIIGNSHIMSHTVVSQGTSIINKDTLEGHIVYQGQQGELLLKQSKRDILNDIFYL